MSSATVDDRPDTGSTPVVAPKRRRSPLRIVGTVVLSLVAAIVAVAVAGLPLYVFPPAAQVTASDLAYVIGPPTNARVDLAEQYVDEGLAQERLVIGFHESNYFYAVNKLPVCREAGVTCAIPEPSTTKGETLVLERYAETHEFDSTIVITFTPHVARTRYIFDKCYDGPGTVTVVGVPTNLSIGDWAYQYAYQSAAFVKAWATGCPE